MEIQDIINTEKIVVHEVSNSLRTLQQYRNMNRGGCQTSVFSMSPEKEEEMLDKYIEAFRLTLTFFTTKGRNDDVGQDVE